jgi:GNAT superfamily N-acetyltransferase
VTIFIRAVGPADLAAVRRIAVAHDVLALWPAGPDFLDCERAFGRLLLGEVDGRIAGFGGVLRRGGLTHLGDLFVAADRQSAGLGRALLDGLLDGADRRVTYASADPRAVALYVRYGMIPRQPLLYLAGPADALSTVDDFGPVPPAEPAGNAALVDLDGTVSGGTRDDTLRWYTGLSTVDGYRTGDGYALARRVDDRVQIGPAGGADPVASARAVIAAGRRYPGRRLLVSLFGTHPLLPALLRAGYRIDDTDTLMSSEDGLFSPDRYVPGVDLG